MSGYLNHSKLRKALVLLTPFLVFCFSNLKAQISYDKRAGGAIGEAPKIGNFNASNGLDNVEYSTGTVNINIPLYEVKAHDIVVPISISYSALGIKVGQEAGAPGMGWELNAGGKIIKQINGRDDEFSNSSNSLTSTTNFSLNPDNVRNDREKLRKVILGVYDYAFDAFSYTLPTAGGRFVKDGLTFPYDPTFKYDGSAGHKITIGDGLVHNFMAGDRILIDKQKRYASIDELSTEMRELSPSEIWGRDIYSYVSDYNLYSIISSKFKDTVKFEYDQKSFVSGIAGKRRITTLETLPLARNLIKKANGTWEDLNGPYYFQGEPVVSQTRTDIVEHYRIKTIIYATGRVRFEYSVNDVLGRDVLTAVIVEQKVKSVYKWLKRYEFNYDPDVQYGHYLTSIEVQDANGAKAGKWSFNYYGGDTSGSFGKLPVDPTSGSMAQDRWGFYNGKTNNKTLLENPDSLISLRDIPHYPSRYKNYPSSSPSSFEYRRNEAKYFYSPNDASASNVAYALRETIFWEALKGTIKKITTPTGESVNYEYESNKYQIQGWTQTGPTTYQSYYKVYDGGGIRVKSITRNDGIMFSGKTLSKKSYKYGVGSPSYLSTVESGYGIVNIPGVVSSIIYKYADGLSTYSSENLNYMSHPLNDLALHKGSSAYYPSVTETIYNGPSLSGETVYYYSPSDVEAGPWNYVIASSTTQLNMPEFYTNQGVKESRPAGQAYRIVEYDGSRLAGTKVRETANTYTNFKAPSSSPKRYSFFGGVRGMLIGQYSSSFRLCTPTAVPGQGLVYDCSWIATIANMDPLGYLYLGPEVEDNYYPGKYYGNVVELSTFSNVYKLSKTVTTSYNFSGIDPMVSTTNYYYDNVYHMQPTRIASFNSNGDTTAVRIKYPLDFPGNTINGVDLLRTANRMSEPVEQVSMIKKDAAYQVTDGVKNTFKSSNGLVLNDKTYRLNTGGKYIPLTGYSENHAGYEEQSSYDFYDEMGNLLLFSNLYSPKTAVLWGYNQQYPIAQVSNVPNIYDVGYTNFESDNKDYLKGFWTYAGIPVVDLTSPAADNVYPLVGKPITKTYYTTGKKYILSYWYKVGSAITVTGGTVGAETKKNVKGNWILAEREITANSTITISGTGFIDELAFYPADGQLSTYTYNVGIGLTRSQDPKGLSTSYEYDNEQRIKYIRDQQGNIVKAYNYNIGSRYK